MRDSFSLRVGLNFAFLERLFLTADSCCLPAGLAGSHVSHPDISWMFSPSSLPRLGGLPARVACGRTSAGNTRRLRDRRNAARYSGRAGKAVALRDSDLA